MRCVIAAWAMFGSAVLLQPMAWLSAAPLDLDNVAPAEPSEQLCDRLAANPFAGFGPDEWGRPFQSIDPYRAIPACTEAMKLHPDERRFVLELALAYIAGDKRDKAVPLLDVSIGEGNTGAMLALAYISPEGKAADLMHRAADRGDPNAMMLFTMSQLTVKGVPKDEIAGIGLLRRAAEAGSTRAMLILGRPAAEIRALRTSLPAWRTRARATLASRNRPVYEPGLGSPTLISPKVDRPVLRRSGPCLDLVNPKPYMLRSPPAVVLRPGRGCSSVG